MNPDDDEWAGVESAIAEIVAARPQEYGTTVRQNLADLLRHIRETNRPAPSVSPGYWPTFQLTWPAAEAPNLEMEVFEDRFEVYRFFDGRTDIWYEPHAPGDQLSPAFEAELPKARDQH